MKLEVNKMKCKKCGHEFDEPEYRQTYPETLEYCPKCGEKIENNK